MLALLVSLLVLFSAPHFRGWKSAGLKLVSETKYVKSGGGTCPSSTFASTFE